MKNELSNGAKILIYVGIFVAAIVFARLSDSGDINKKPNGSDVQKEENSYSLNNINNDYHASKVYFRTDDDAITLTYDKINDVIAGTRKYHGEEIDYIFYNEKYYKLVDEKFETLNDFVAFPYDETFIKLDNLKELLKLDKSEVVSETQVKYTFDAKKVVGLYSELNENLYVLKEDGEVILTFNLEEDEIKNIELDFTTVYNFIHEKDYEEVIYVLEFETKKEEDNSWLKELLN